MRVVIAPDKFKGSASAGDMAERIARSLLPVTSNLDPVLLPVADGGEGSLEALASTDARSETRCVEDAWGEPTDAQTLWMGNEAWIEMSQTAGSGSRSGPTAALAASSRGAGLLLDRLRDAERVYVAIGGTLSSDGGAGLASVLGWRFLDADGSEVPLGARGLPHLERVVAESSPAFTCVGACDVMAPLLGPRGAAHRFAPQKGADAEGVALIEAGLERFADVIERDLDLDVRELAGGGAGGGTGAGLAAFLNAQLQRGFDLIAARIGLEDAIASADLVITGEGTFDEQTLEGKAPLGVLQLAQRHGIPCALLAGRIAADPVSAGYTAHAVLDEGIDAAVRRLTLAL